ncbi:CLIP domain-containing protein [Trichonephila clavipes]|nr:CLIP domain-containing protein [Trichonephila clavipes]
MITKFFIPQLNNHDVQELWFQQDGATCHTARATIDLLKDTFGDRLISRFGPSLVYADKPQTLDHLELDHLEDNIRGVIADIRPQMLEKVIENWTSRLDYIQASRGSHMPEIIFKMIKRNLLPKLIAGVFTFYVYLLPVVLAGNWQRGPGLKYPKVTASYYGTTRQNVINHSSVDWKPLREFLGLVRSGARAYNNPRRQGYHQTDETLLNLCHIPNGQEGECRAISECWASQYNNYKFQSCGWNRYRETFCCPNWNEENVKFVSWYAQSPYRYPGEAISKTAPEPTRSSVRSFLGEIVEPIISSLFNVHSDEDDEENQRVTPGPISTTTKRSLRLPESVAVNFPIRYPATIPPRWPTERPAVVPPSRPAVVPPSRPAVVPPSRPAVVPPSRPAVVPPSRPAVVPPSRPAVVPPSRPAVVPPSRPAVVPPSRLAVVPPSRPAEVPPSRPAEVPPSRPAVVPPSRPAVVPPSRPAVVPPSRPAVVPPSRPAVVPPSRPAVVPSSRPAIVLPVLDSIRRPNLVPTASTPTKNTQNNLVMPTVSFPFPFGCGRKHSENKHVLDARAIQPYVVGGYDAKDRSWPWMVSIHVSRNGTPRRYFCGGSLITYRHVLTAAHCFDAVNRRKHFKGMEILPDGSRSYVECKHCPSTQLDPKHLSNCPSIDGALLKIDNDCSMDILYWDRAIDVATAVIHAFGNILLYPYGFF